MKSASTTPAIPPAVNKGRKAAVDKSADLAEYDAMSKKLDNSKIKRLLAKLRPIQIEIERNDPEF